MSQTVALTEGTYVVSLDAAQRYGDAHNQELEVLLNGSSLGTFTPSGTGYTSFTSSSMAIGTPGSYTLVIEGLNPSGGDNTAFIDNVALSESFGGSTITVADMLTPTAGNKDQSQRLPNIESPILLQVARQADLEALSQTEQKGETRPRSRSKHSTQSFTLPEPGIWLLKPG